MYRSPRLLVCGYLLLLATSSAFAKIDIEIKGVDDDIADNVRQFLTLSRYATRDDLTADSVARLQKRIPAEAAQALQPFGYYQPKITYQVTQQAKTKKEKEKDREKEKKKEKEKDKNKNSETSPKRSSESGPGNSPEKSPDKEEVTVGGEETGGENGKKIGEEVGGKAGKDLGAEAGEEAEQDWKIAIQIDPGTPVELSKVDITVSGPGADAARIQTLLERHELRPGIRLDHGAYDLVKASLLRAATSSGYLDAHYTRNELLIDTDTRTADVDLHLDTGERYRFGPIFIEQNVIRDGSMQRLLRMKQGDPYSNDALLSTQYVLDDTQYFSSVEIASDQPDKDTHEVPVRIKAQRGKRNRYAVSTGYATDTGARGKLTWDDRLVNTSGHKTSFEVVESQPLREVTARYIVPVRDIALEKVEFTLSSKHEELADTLSKRNEFTTGLTQVLGRWQRVLFLKFSNETSVLPGETFTDFLIIPGISFSTLPNYVMGREPLPYSLFVELTGSPHSLGSDASYVRFRIEGERVFNLTRKWHLRLRSQLGVSYVANFSELPLSQRFFAGGDNSVRGFALNELSPVDAHGNKIGGRDLVFGSVELERDLPRNFGWAVFSDVGNAVNHFSDPLEYSVGVGLRYRIAVASLGVDVAQELSEPGHGPRLHLHLSTVF